MSPRPSADGPATGTACSSMILSGLPHSTSNTASSSRTYLDQEDSEQPQPKAKSPLSSSSLVSEIANEEHDIEEYAGDDPHEPTADKTPAQPEEEKDSSVVSWDGTDDPENPKNWSSAYRWLLTGLCCITTVNVYVLFFCFCFDIQ